MYIMKNSAGEYHECNTAKDRDEYLANCNDNELLETIMFDVVNVKTFQVQKRIVPVKVIKEEPKE